MLIADQEITTNVIHDQAMHVAELLRINATSSLHEQAANLIENLLKQMQADKEEAYEVGRSHGLYAARDAITKKFGL